MDNSVHQLFLLFLSISCVLSAWEDGHDGVDRRNGDLPDMPITLNSTSPPSQCAKLCDSKIECKAWAYCKMNCNGQQQAPLCYLKAQVTAQSLDPCRVSGVKNATFLPPKFHSLPVGAIKPEGWLKQQLQIQAAGLSGHLPLFWADVENSSWIGGKADTGLHERTPYWLNGFVPLAYQLNDPQLIALVEKYIWYILGHQTDDGWLGNDDIGDGNCYWSKYPILFALRMYYEATGNNTVIPAIYKFLHTAYTRMFTRPLGVTWSGARWQDFVLSVHWLLDFHSNGEEQFLWDLAELIHDQGFNWKAYYAGPDFPKESATTLTLYTHGVNNGQAIKSAGVWYRQSQNKSDWDSSYQRIQVLDTYHGQASGIFACDEHLAGKMPSRGTELCTVVETMYSYEVLFGIQGDPMFAERAEQLGYNALPATITSDMWAHQYLQQDNEMNAIHSDDHIWYSDGPDATLFGLAPNYGCCTGNFNQGWPKLTQHTVMISPDGNTIVFAIYAPLSVTMGGTTLTVNTQYPFNESVTITGTCSGKKTILLRIPSWAEGATLRWGSTPSTPVTPGTLHPTSCEGNVEMELILPMKIRVTRRYNNAASIYCGALLYGLEIKEEFKELRSYAYESKDYQITPGSPWNYAIHLTDDDNPSNDLKFQSVGWKEGVIPFSIAGAPSKIQATGRILDTWGIAHNAADKPPTSPVTTNNADTPVTLLPFGATDLRIAELPTYK